MAESNRSVPMTIAALAAPPTVPYDTAFADGAVTVCPVELVDGLVVQVGDRVTADVRTPRRPLVTGKVETT